jgi:hypothetical protein
MVNNWEPNHIVVFKKVKPLQQSQQTHKHVFFFGFKWVIELENLYQIYL